MEFSSMQSLVSVINQVQDVFSQLGCGNLNLPQIVAIGSQSSGKSSVIESIVGRDFLPRGNGIVTRCPLVLQLIPVADDCMIKEENDEDAFLDACEANDTRIEWAKFLHKPNMTYTDFTQVRKEIELQTDILGGQNKGICAEPITLKIYSNKVANLTLIDLPGLTKVPVGDQPDDIEIQIKQLILNYITNPNSIILAVSVANQDFATSEALKLARDVDPDGKRTLAVLTKIDIMDQGTDVMDVLNGRVIPVKLGIIAMINRCQKDITTNKSIKNALEYEKEFLEKYYLSVAHLNGTPFLVKTLSRLLMYHIQSCLPELKEKVKLEISQHEIMLESFGKKVIDQSQTMLKIISSFASCYRSAIEGNNKNMVKNTKLSSGAKISNLFHKTLFQELLAIDPSSLGDDVIQIYISNASGTKPHMFVPESAFERIVKDAIEKFELPALRCIESVEKELEMILRTCITEVQDLARFPKICDTIRRLVRNFVNSRAEIAKKQIKKIMSYELAYINVKHPDLKDSELFSTTAEANNMSVKSRESRDCDLIKKMVVAYFKIIRTKFQDSIPKLVMCSLINYVVDNMEEELHSMYQEREKFDTLFAEHEDLHIKRSLAEKRLDALKEADEVIAGIQDDVIVN